MSGATLFSDLTEAQALAVAHTDGPLLVLAGPGSGKTRVITRRAAHIATTVATPDQVLAITFTNKAAGEMRDRILGLGVGRGRNGPMWICTFHSFCARILRESGVHCGLKPGFSIFDDAEQRSLLKESIVAAGLSTDNWPPRMAQEMISNAKNQLCGPKEFEESANDYTRKAVASIYAGYQERLREQNAVDFDDLLMYVARILLESEQVRMSLGDRFRYLLIDEYQDTNHAQYVIAKQLASGHQNICATGDPDQSIYAWRGANIQNILDFEKDFPDAKVVRLEENFRSTGYILSSASELIRKNYRRKEKELWSRRGQGLAVRVWACDDERQEAAAIASDIRAFVDDGGSDIAIFYRINALTRVLEDELRQRQIPYKIVRGVEFYNRKEIKDVLAYLRAIVNPADELALLRALNTPPRGIGRTTIDNVRDIARHQGVTLFEAIMSCVTGNTDGDAPRKGAAMAKKLAPFAAILERLRAMPPRPVAPIVKAVLAESGLERSLEQERDVDGTPIENVSELVTAAQQYDLDNPDGALGEWLHQISLVSDADALEPGAGSVLLMTLHTAKGLEFNRVYMVGLEDGLLPHRRALNGHEDDDLEEERRLCFVGMTRARECLTMSWAKYRMVRGITERTLVSRFLKELARDELEQRSFEAHRDRSRSHLGRANFDDDASPDAFEYYPGRRVKHEEYGEGEVVRLEPHGKSMYIRIYFPEYGERAFALDHVPLYVMD